MKFLKIADGVIKQHITYLKFRNRVLSSSRGNHRTQHYYYRELSWKMRNEVANSNKGVSRLRRKVSRLQDIINVKNAEIEYLREQLNDAP